MNVKKVKLCLGELSLARSNYQAKGDECEKSQVVFRRAVIRRDVIRRSVLHHRRLHEPCCTCMRVTPVDR